MKQIIKVLNNAWSIAKSRNWDKIYWAIDLHGTVIKPTYKEFDDGLEYYPDAKKTLQLLSKSASDVLILYTCSYPHEIEKILKLFVKDDIVFKYVNENPEIKNTNYGYYEKKPYFSIMLDDKAGFDPCDWESLFEALINSQIK
jgi:hypothetical protein